MRVLTTAALAACLFIAPAYALDAPQVTTDQFSKDITILGPSDYENPFGGTFRSWRIRSTVDKQTGAATSQLYVELHYYWAWRFYESAATDHAEPLQVTPIDRQVEDCSGMCSYREVIGIALDEAMMRARVATGMQIKISAHSGDSIIITLSAEQIAAQLGALDQYAHTAAVASSPGASTPGAPPMPKGRFGVHGVPLNEGAAAALHIASDHGFMVLFVDDGSPAAKAGIVKADVLLTFNGVEMRSPEALRAAVTAVGVGALVQVHLWRAGQEIDLKTQF
jgi:hypothetical protein